MNSFGQVISSQRVNARLGVRELCRQTEKSLVVSAPLSPAYLSRLERKTGEIDPEKVGIDILWSLGVALQTDPLLLFVVSRPVVSDLRQREKRESLFTEWDVPDLPLGEYLRARRHQLGLSIAEVARLASHTPYACFGISSGFLSQVETDFRGLSGVISGEKLWALGVVLGVDPLALFALSRRLGRGLHLRHNRILHFRHFSL